MQFHEEHRICNSSPCTFSIFYHCNLLSCLCLHHLPPIWPLEQTRWVRRRVTHSSLRVAEVLVVVAEPRRWFGQVEGAHRPRRRWPSPKRGSFTAAHLQLTHLSFQVNGQLNRGRSPFAVCSVLFVPHNCTKRQLSTSLFLWICGHNCECHAQADTCMLCLQTAWVQWLESHNGTDSFLKRSQLFHCYPAGVFVSSRQSQIFVPEWSNHHAYLGTSLRKG